jgi:N utilization substance protein B
MSGGGKGRQDRRQGRHRAVRYLFAADIKRFEDDGRLSLSDDAMIGAQAQEFAEQLLAGVLQERQAIDAAVNDRLKNWTVLRMAVVDRSLLRLGAYELLYSTGTPPKVVINEYIELGKQLGSEPKTPGLINAVLDRIAKDFPRQK